jgi:hypothetical protein
MNRRSLVTVLAGLAAVPAFAMAAGAAPLAPTSALEPLTLPVEMQRRRVVIVRRPARRVVVVRRRPAFVIRRPRRVCVRRAGILVCR